MDANGVLAAVYDRANRRLSITQVAGPSTDTTHAGDENYVWSKVFDATTNTIRVVLVP